MAGARAETVTVVFTDIVGSTRWRSQVGDDVADARTAELERASREVVESLGGTVVKSLGDGVMATFPSATAGLDAAVALQSVARRLALGGRACLRVGVSSGDMVREGADWLGIAAIEASRLCADAAGGSVLVADVTRHLCHGRAHHALRPAGERLLRGFDAPIEVHELVIDDGQDSLPSALGHFVGAPMVGRRSEQERAGSLLEAATAGGARTLVIVGEPGVGKSRLAAAVADEGPRSRLRGGLRTLRGRTVGAVSAGRRSVRAVVGGLPRCRVAAHRGRKRRPARPAVARVGAEDVVAP